MLQDMDKPLDAIPFFKDSLQYETEDWLVNLNIGNSLALQSEIETEKDNLVKAKELLEESCTYYYKALEIKPDYNIALGNLASNLRDLGRYDEAMICLAQVIEDQPEYSFNYWKRARIHSKLGNFSEASLNTLTAS